jgi:ketosteroid isomerase-like protein
MVSPFRSRSLALTCLLLVPLAQACTADEPGETELPPPALEEPAPAAAPAATTAEAPAELRGTWDRYLAAWNAEDPAALGAFFTEDATVQSGDSTYTGRTAIQDRWLARNLPVLSNLQPTPERFQQTGTDLVEEGRYTFLASPPQGAPETVTGRYTTTWTRAPDGTWKVRSVTIREDAA